MTHLGGHLFIIFNMTERKLHRFLNFLDLVVQSPNVSIGLSLGTFPPSRNPCHPSAPHHSIHLVVEQDRAARFQQILFYKQKDADVMF